MENVNILWVDDEIDLLKPQILFLEKRGYHVHTVTNGHDAVEECENRSDFDVVFLDESMPGITGLETLEKLKELRPHLPIIMITKNEAEQVMEEAIGSQISDYLIKPVNPNQILLTLKRIIDHKRLVSEKTNSDYQVQFREIFMDINNNLDFKEWVDVYKKIINWELKLDASQSDQMGEILSTQKSQANVEFTKFVVRNYEDWIRDKDKEHTPVFSPDLMQTNVFPHIDDRPTFFLLLDNLRFDQWKVLEPIFSELFTIEKEDFFYSILPTSTQYSRNAIFSGLLPNEISKRYPQYWKNDFDDGGKNLFEAELLAENIKRNLKKEIKHDYFKVTNVAKGKQLDDNIHNYLKNDLTVIVYNFIDMLSHARTEMEVLKELAGDETAYRSLTKSWFEHSPLWSALQKIAEKDIRVIVGTDHGTIRVQQPSKVIADRDTTTNLRYKVGKNLNFDKKDVLHIHDPRKVGLPSPNVSSSFIFAREDKYFLYPNNYNYYNKYFRDTFQHGGISLEEIICPVITMYSK